MSRKHEFILKNHEYYDILFEIAKIVRQSSPLLSKKALSLQPDKQQQKLEQAESATQSLFALWDDGKIPSCIDVLRNLKESGLYELSERMEEIIDGLKAQGIQRNFCVMGGEPLCEENALLQQQLSLFHLMITNSPTCFLMYLYQDFCTSHQAAVT